MLFQHKVFFLTVVLILALSCTPHFFKHDQNIAAKEAVKIANLLFVKQDVETGFEIQRAGQSEEFTLEKLRAFVNDLHKSGVFPNEVWAIEYEPMPGQEGMKIYLTGRNKDDFFWYQFVMIGTEPKGYRVFAIYRFDGEFPASTLRKPLK